MGTEAASFLALVGSHGVVPIRNSWMYWQWQMQNDRRTLWALVAFIFPFCIPLSLLPPSVVECGQFRFAASRWHQDGRFCSIFFLGIIGWARVCPRLDLLLVIQMQTRKGIRKSYVRSLRTVPRIGAFRPRLSNTVVSAKKMMLVFV
jgi:hypothetical protein